MSTKADPLDVMLRLVEAEAEVAKLRETLIGIHDLVFADLPEVTSASRNRLQRIAAMCQLALPELMKLKRPR